VVVFAANDKKTYHLIDEKGHPVLTKRPGECVETPLTFNEPAKLFEACGDNGDKDNDGVFDDEDKCPDNTPEEIAQGVYTKGHRMGCPKDSDGDAVPDYRDRCPNTPAVIVQVDRAKGTGYCITTDGCIKDEDNDNVPDCFDDCLQTSAGIEVDEKGCGKKGDVFTTIIASDVTFGFDQASLTLQGKAALSELARSITQQIDYIQNVEIVGHTDDIGSKPYNQNLSEKRAKAVVDYLVTEGVLAAKVTQRGEGETRPIADNATKVGRAKNRRVEINITMYEKTEVP
jgi:OOP family OmpA-OmpF porin